MKYYIETPGASYDNLHGGPEFPQDLRNVSISGGAEKGDIIAGINHVFTKIAGDSDTIKTLAIAAEDTESTDTAVISAYFAGKFNIGALSFGSATPEIIEQELRKSNIILTEAI